jgi:hypothetical protein
MSLGSASAGGKHYGEMKMIYAEIEFFNPYGTFITDHTGSYYIFQGQTIHATIFYPQEYWGEYPLYFPGSTVSIKVSITNNGPRAIAKHTVVAEAYVINPDGSVGAQVLEPQIFETDYYGDPLDVALGETKFIDASFIVPVAAKRITCFTISLYHHHNDNNNASLIMTKDAFFCPPEDLDLLEGNE